MFTGIIEEIGSIASKGTGSMSIKAIKVMDGLQLGDSIAVNGVCLTITSFKNNLLTVDVMSETLSRSNLGNLVNGSLVNLERAVQIGGRLGGHIVTGHIDGKGEIKNIKSESNAVWFEIACEKSILKYVVEKGSVTLDGISLTVAYVDEYCFKVSVIPHTMAQTSLIFKKTGDKLNIEVDILSKYIEKLLDIGNKKQMDIDFLHKCGF